MRQRTQLDNILRPSIVAGFVLALLNASRAYVWSATDETMQLSLGVAGLVPDVIAITLWMVASVTTLLAYWSLWCRVVGISLTAGLHAAVAISAVFTLFQPLTPELASTVGSYGTVAILTLLMTRMTDNRTVLEGRPDGLE